QVGQAVAAEVGEGDGDGVGAGGEGEAGREGAVRAAEVDQHVVAAAVGHHQVGRSEEHTSELQSPCNLVCRLLLEKKKKNRTTYLGRVLRTTMWLLTDAVYSGATDCSLLVPLESQRHVIS